MTGESPDNPLKDLAQPPRDDLARARHKKAAMEAFRQQKSGSGSEPLAQAQAKAEAQVTLARSAPKTPAPQNVMRRKQTVIRAVAACLFLVVGFVAFAPHLTSLKQAPNAEKAQATDRLGESAGTTAPRQEFEPTLVEAMPAPAPAKAKKSAPKSAELKERDALYAEEELVAEAELADIAPLTARQNTRAKDARELKKEQQSATASPPLQFPLSLNPNHITSVKQSLQNGSKPAPNGIDLQAFVDHFTLLSATTPSAPLSVATALTASPWDADTALFLVYLQIQAGNAIGDSLTRVNLSIDFARDSVEPVLLAGDSERKTSHTFHFVTDQITPPSSRLIVFEVSPHPQINDTGGGPNISVSFGYFENNLQRTGKVSLKNHGLQENQIVLASAATALALKLKQDPSMTMSYDDINRLVTTQAKNIPQEILRELDQLIQLAKPLN